jgi:hypothetical protein
MDAIAHHLHHARVRVLAHIKRPDDCETLSVWR